MDMYPVMKAFVEAGYQGTMILDHTPRFVGGPGKVEKRYAAIVYNAETAYAIGYMRALMERAEAELNAD
jgi:D-mannonate dehydratase